MRRTRPTPGERPCAAAPGRCAPGDTGSTLIEALVAIVLVGLAAAATLTAMTTTIRASGQHDDHAGAQSWLVSAADVLTSPGTARVSCTGGEPAVRAAYDAAVQAVTEGRPAGSGWAISILTPVGFSNGTAYGDSVSNPCFETVGLTTQAVTLRVTSSTYGVAEQLTVVKSDG